VAWKSPKTDAHAGRVGMAHLWACRKPAL